MQTPSPYRAADSQQSINQVIRLLLPSHLDLLLLTLLVLARLPAALCRITLTDILSLDASTSRKRPPELLRLT